jgi:hypothetical protein
VTALLQITGASLVFLAFFHLVIWRMLHWTEESARMSPLNARVFAVHTFFVTFVLGALGALTALRPELLLQKSDLGRYVLFATVLFWLCRLLIQLLVFDPVLWLGRPWRTLARIAASLVWCAYSAIFAVALAGQLR